VVDRTWIDEHREHAWHDRKERKPGGRCELRLTFVQHAERSKLRRIAECAARIGASKRVTQSCGRGSHVQILLCFGKTCHGECARRSRGCAGAMPGRPSRE